MDLPPGAKPRINAYLLGPGMWLYGKAASHSGSDFTFTPIYKQREKQIHLNFILLKNDKIVCGTQIYLCFNY